MASMLRTLPLKLASLVACTSAVLAGCGSGSGTAPNQSGATAELLQALPDRQSLTVSMPGSNTSGHGLSPGTGTTERGVVGQPADLYTNGYAISQSLNGIAGFLVNLLDGITAHPPTAASSTIALWGPFSKPLEPNEFALAIVKKADPAKLHYDWLLQGKPKGIQAWSLIAGGSFEPGAGHGLGQGWFLIDFDASRRLDPTQNPTGHILYALAKSEQGVLVQALIQSTATTTTATTSAYRYGADPSGAGFMEFLFKGDVDNGKNGRTKVEDVLLRTRWEATGPGLAHATVTHGDLGSSVAEVVQCWDGRFVSTFEAFSIDGGTPTTGGDVKTCAIPLDAPPELTDLPTLDKVTNPHS